MRTDLRLALFEVGAHSGRLSKRMFIGSTERQNNGFSCIRNKRKQFFSHVPWTLLPHKSFCSFRLSPLQRRNLNDFDLKAVKSKANNRESNKVQTNQDLASGQTEREDLKIIFISKRNSQSEQSWEKWTWTKEMGSFIGHVVPGTFFIMFGVWWTLRVWELFLRSLSGGRRWGQRGEDSESGGGTPRHGFSCRATYPPTRVCARCCCGLRGRRPVDCEAVLAVAASVVGMLIELLPGGAHIGGRHMGVNNMQHATMYFFFGLVGLIGLLTPSLRRLFPNMEDIRFISLAIAFAAEAILFKFHLMGRDAMDITLHTLLVYAIYGCVIMTLLEFKYRNQPLASLGRAFFTILQGTWFWQVGFILYNPFATPGNDGWDHEDHHHIMLTALIYTWHMAAIFIFSLGVAVGWACVLKKRGELEDFELTMEPVSNGYSHLLSQDQDEPETVVKLETDH